VFCSLFSCIFEIYFFVLFAHAVPHDKKQILYCKAGHVVGDFEKGQIAG
jgi:hypothetical protein